MGNNKKPENRDRRWFLSSLLGIGKNVKKTDMVKMLTADGKLVEVERSVLEKASVKKTATNKEIYNWMDNPSKKQ